MAAGHQSLSGYGILLYLLQETDGIARIALRQTVLQQQLNSKVLATKVTVVALSR